MNNGNAPNGIAGDCYLVWIISAFAFGALILVLIKMKPGFGPTNLRVLGIVVVASFATLLGLQNQSLATAAMGILGSIAGYLFGMKDEKKKEVDEPKNDATAQSGSPANDPNVQN